MDTDLDWQKWDQLQSISEGEEALCIGSGRQEMPGWVTLDRRDLAETDVAHDILHVPWPLEADRFEVVLCEDILEHIPARTSYVTENPPADSSNFQIHTLNENKYLVNYQVDCFLLVAEEIFRILTPGGLFLIQAPSPGGGYELADPTHIRRIHPEMFNHWDPDHEHYGMSFDSQAKFKYEWQDKSEGNFLLALKKVT